MRFLWIVLSFSLLSFAHAQDVVPLNSSGAETVAKENAASLGFKVELTNVGELVRFRIVLPDRIRNGFEYAYTSVEVDGSDDRVILMFRPETHVEVLSDSKFVQFVAPVHVLPCVRVSAIYLNSDRPMHSDYFMSIDVRSFLEGDDKSCEIDTTSLSNQ
jgi:hypothetical protein